MSWKSKFPRVPKEVSRNGSRGFSLIEVLVATGLFFLFLSSIVFIYQRTMANYQATAWKQDKASQGERFWQLLRKHLDEASNKNWVSESGTDFNVETKARPLLFRSVGPDDSQSVKNGKVLAWTRSHLDESGNIAYQLYCILTLENRALKLEVAPYPGSPSPPSGEVFNRVVLEDVDAFVVKATPIRQSEQKGDYLTSSYSGSAGDPVVGTLAEISLVLNPPANSSIKKISVTLNDKFKLGVDSTSQSLGDANFPYPPTD